MNASEVAIGVPLIAVTVSPGWSPARAAGDPGVTGWGQFCDALLAICAVLLAAFRQTPTKACCGL